VLLPCWDDKPARRPKFNAIVNSIEQFRRGGDEQGGYYAANDGADEHGVYYAAN